MREQWRSFQGTKWQDEVDVRDFIQKNYTPYDGDETFLSDPTEATNALWSKLQELQKEERAKGGVLDMETEIVSSLTAYGPGYINEELKELEQIVGLQTDRPLKRAFMPYGGIRMSEEACTTYDYTPSEKLQYRFRIQRWRKNLVLQLPILLSGQRRLSRKQHQGKRHHYHRPRRYGRDRKSVV